jgi:hypothetical protein
MNSRSSETPVLRCLALAFPFSRGRTLASYMVARENPRKLYGREGEPPQVLQARRVWPDAPCAGGSNGARCSDFPAFSMQVHRCATVPEYVWAECLWVQRRQTITGLPLAPLHRVCHTATGELGKSVWFEVCWSDTRLTSLGVQEFIVSSFESRLWGSVIVPGRCLNWTIHAWKQTLPHLAFEWLWV